MQRILSLVQLYIKGTTQKNLLEFITSIFLYIINPISETKQINVNSYSSIYMFRANLILHNILMWNDN